MVRVLLGALPTWFHSALTESVRSRADLEVVGVAIQPTELLLDAGARQADVVLVAMADGGVPGIASHLLDQYPHIKVLAVAFDGQEVLLYSLRPQIVRVPTPSLEELITTIRTLAGPPAD
jgi:DNA-binding NarL/FixJ family response regulator